MKCSMISLALNGANAPGAEELAGRYIDGLAGRTTTRKLIQGLVESNPVLKAKAPKSNK